MTKIQRTIVEQSLLATCIRVKPDTDACPNTAQAKDSLSRRGARGPSIVSSRDSIDAFDAGEQANPRSPLGRTGRIDRLSGGLCKSDDFTAIKQRMASFMAAGFLEICGKKKASGKG